MFCAQILIHALKHPEQDGGSPAGLNGIFSGTSLQFTKSAAKNISLSPEDENRRAFR